MSLEKHKILLDTGSGMAAFWDEHLTYLKEVLDAIDQVAKNLGSTGSVEFFRPDGDSDRQLPSDTGALAKVLRRDSFKGASRLGPWLNTIPPIGAHTLLVFVGTLPEIPPDLERFRDTLRQSSGLKTPSMAFLRFTPLLALPADASVHPFDSLYIVAIGEQSAVLQFVYQLDRRDTSSWPRRETTPVDRFMIVPRPFRSMVRFGSWSLSDNRATGFDHNNVTMETVRSVAVVRSRDPIVKARSNGKPDTELASIEIVQGVACFAQVLGIPKVRVSNSRISREIDATSMDWTEVRLNGGMKSILQCNTLRETENQPFLKVDSPQEASVGALVFEVVVNRDRLRAMYPMAKTAEITVLITGKADGMLLPAWIKMHTGDRNSFLKVSGSDFQVRCTPKLSDLVQGMAHSLEECYTTRVASGIEGAAMAEARIMVRLD